MLLKSKMKLVLHLGRKRKKLIKKKHTCSDNEEGRKSQRHLSYNRGALSD